MTAVQYEKISAPFRSEKGTRVIKYTNKALTLAGYASYPIILAYLFFADRAKLLPAVCVPAAGFILLTFVRKRINRMRPYEALQIVPLIYKDTKGKSMPSRHVFSMTIIAVTAFAVSWQAGAVLMLFSFMLAAIRVIGGVHYPSDVIAGIASAVVWGAVWYWVLL